jgi:hypothetical protein
MAVAITALFVALGGAGYAAINIPNNSVTAADIKKNAVKAPEIAKNAVRSPDVKNRSLKCVDIAPAACALTAGDGPGNLVVRSNTVTLPVACETQPGTSNRSCSGGETPVTASCGPGERATGGGYEGMGEFAGPTIEPGEVERQSTETARGDRPEPATGTPTGWTVFARGGATRFESAEDPPAPTFTVYVVCAS